jgi:pyruvate formate lyase activating enzyme
VALWKNAKTVRPSLLGTTVGSKVRCGVCARRCLIEPGATAWCQTRANHDGVLVVTIYGAVAALGADPIEKKPLYHFRPGVTVLTAGGLSCNFHCPWCRNIEFTAGANSPEWYCVDPARFVETARRMQCQGVALSYNEPVLSLEWATEVFPIARRAGLATVLVTNGYLTAEAFELLIEAGLEAVNIDVKGNAETLQRWCGGASGEQVWNSCRYARRAGLHLEIATPLIPGVNDEAVQLREIARRIAGDLGPATPWHLTAYRPAGKFYAPAAAPEAVRERAALARSEGLQFVYPGNVPPGEDFHTWCPSCMNLLVMRGEKGASSPGLNAGACRDCGYLLPGRFTA